MNTTTTEAEVLVKKYLVSLEAYRPLFIRPVQGQRWDEPGGHAVVPWGDIFFDLFYVAAAYNLANIIVNNPTSEGLLYFTGCFWAVHYMWLEETLYEARYIVGDDLWHRFFHVSFYLVVASAILHIRPVALMSHPSEHVDMFAFALACVLANLFTMARYVEVILVGEGEKAAKVSSKREIFAKLVPTGLYLAATIVSGIEYYSSSSQGTNNVPIILICCAALVEILWGFIYLHNFYPNGERRKEISVPINTDYIVHRYGEWTMLMLGECILSLLIVEVVSKGREYYTTFYTGIVSVTLLMYLYFVSGPSEAEEHAMHRHRQASYIITVLMQFYSAGLVIVGASYKLFMYEYTYDNFEEEFGRIRMLYEYVRSLAGKGLGDFPESARRQQIAYFFCFSLGVVWLCSDVMLLMHKGLYYNWKRLRHETTDEVRHVAVILVLARVGLLAFIATLWLYATDPHYLAAIGMCCIIVQVGLRVVGNIAFPHQSDAAEGSRVNVDSGGGDANKVSNKVNDELPEGDPVDAELGTPEQEVEVTNE